jgi:hypothetical protein
MELQSDVGRIVLTYYAKAINIVAGGQGHQEGAIIEEDGSSKMPYNSLGKDLSRDGKFIISGQGLYNLALHKSYGFHSIVIEIIGKGFQLYMFTFG